MNTARNPLIQARHLRLAFDSRTVLEDINLVVHPGEIVTLIGPNGAGKSTLVRMLLGLIKPDSGSVVKQPGLRIGYMPQNLIMNTSLPLTTGRFLSLNITCPKSEITNVLMEVNAHHLINKSIHNISGGELQRVLLARTLLRSPQLLVLDEPVRGVDVTGQTELYRLIAKVRQTHNCGILMISHDLHLVMAATDHVICLNRHVCCTGHPENITRDPAYLALFGPDTTPDLAVYTHKHDHRHDLRGDIVAPADEQGISKHHG